MSNDLAYTTLMKKQRYKQTGHLEKRVGVRLTEEEYLDLQRMAKKHKMTMSNYIRNYLKYEVLTI